MRIFEQRHLLRLSADNVAAAVELLERPLRGLLVELIIGIARGGTDPAARLAATLRVPLVTIAARHNADDTVFAPPRGIVEVGPVDDIVEREPSRVLVVDDIWGTGATMRAVVDRVRVAAPVARVWTATLCRNDGAIGWPDWYVWPVRDWVLFPWETTPSVSLPVQDLQVPEELCQPPGRVAEPAGHLAWVAEDGTGRPVWSGWEVEGCGGVFHAPAPRACARRSAASEQADERPNRTPT